MYSVKLVKLVKLQVTMLFLLPAQVFLLTITITTILIMASTAMTVYTVLHNVLPVAPWYDRLIIRHDLL
jgi:hypothetical protein